MSKYQFSIDELTDNDRDQQSKITLREEQSAENLESEFLVKKELVENGTYRETTVFPSQDNSVDMIGLTRMIEPKVEQFEFKFLFQNELVENAASSEAMILPSQDESVIMSGDPNLKVENMEIMEHYHPWSFDEKSKPFEIISDNSSLISSIKKETLDTEIQERVAIQEKVIQSFSHEGLKTDPLDIKIKIEPIEISGTEVFQYEGKFDEGTENTLINLSPNHQLDFLVASDEINQEVTERASRQRKRMRPPQKLTNYDEKGEDNVDLDTIKSEKDLDAIKFASQKLKIINKKKESENEELRSFKCSDCDSSFSQKRFLKNHMDRIHLKTNLKKISCTICKSCFATKTRLEEHMNSVHLKIKPFKCNSCDSLFASKRFLNDHVRVKHLKIKPFKCSNCPASFPKDKELKQHVLAVHEKMKPFKCGACNASFSQKVHLKSHVDRVHLKLKPLKKIKCSECDSCYEKKQQLDRHMNSIHTKIKPYKCSGCDSLFSRKDQLKLHFDAVHLGLKNYKCSECDMAYTAKYNLKVHMDRVHLKTKPYRCDSCDSAFATSTGLKSHINCIHLKLKNHKCPNCNKSFADKSNLRVHIKSHQKVTIEKKKKNIFPEK